MQHLVFFLLKAKFPGSLSQSSTDNFAPGWEVEHAGWLTNNLKVTVSCIYCTLLPFFYTVLICGDKVDPQTRIVSNAASNGVTVKSRGEEGDVNNIRTKGEGKRPCERARILGTTNRLERNSDAKRFLGTRKPMSSFPETFQQPDFSVPGSRKPENPELFVFCRCR